MFRKRYFPKRSFGLFLAAFVVLCLLYNYPYIYRYGPRGHHTWRQADCYSMATNYYFGHRSFLDPQVHFCSPAGPQETVSEMPLLNYSVAQLWRIFGYHPWVYRAVQNIILFLGLLCLFRIFELSLRNTWWALGLSLLFFTTPLLSTYGISFIADASAMCIAICGGWFWFRYHRWNRWTDLVFAALLTTIAGWMKITSLYTLGIVCSLALAGLLPGKKRMAVFRRPAAVMISAGVVLLLVAAWYVYADHYNKTHDEGVFLVGILPVWDMTWAEIVLTSRSLVNDLLPVYFNRPVLFFLSGVMLWMFLDWRRMGKVSVFILSVSALIVLLYLLLFFQVFTVHDYYLVNMLPFVAVLLLVAARYVRKTAASLFHDRRVQVVSGVVLLFSAWNCAMITRIRYSSIDPFAETSVFISQEEYSKWHNFDHTYEKDMINLQEARPVFDSLKITRDDIVISIPDPSPDYSLVMMDRKGYTDCSYSSLGNRGDRIHAFISYGANYLVLNCEGMQYDPDILPYTKFEMGRFRQARIYDLRPYADSIRAK
ncbi:MAG TPA: hypothetical protein VFU15_12635 [Bacteroidia bacterium]|nr:hypothetical protein [Bacteroidia bacterium]